MSMATALSFPYAVQASVSLPQTPVSAMGTLVSTTNGFCQGSCRTTGKLPFVTGYLRRPAGARPTNLKPHRVAALDRNWWRFCAGMTGFIGLMTNESLS